MSEILLGPFDEIYRKQFLDRAALEYLMRHPDERISQARRMARAYWRKHVYNALKEQNGNTKPKTYGRRGVAPRAGDYHTRVI